LIHNIKICLNPECNKEFIPGPTWNIKFCSRKCQEYTYNKNYWLRIDNKKYRKKDNCIVCNNYRRVQNNKKCDSCNNIKRIGLARKPRIGNCKICKRGPLTLAGGRCKSCTIHGHFKGTNIISHGELLLRERVNNRYNGNEIIHNYKPEWLSRRNKQGKLIHLELDVAVVNLKLGFEYDGRFHYDTDNPQFLKVRERDNLKNKLCYDNGWNLFRIHGNHVLKNDQDFNDILNELDNVYEFGIPLSHKYHKYIKLAAFNERMQG
jgi:very-short-patch-repair endonuclease